MRGGGLVEGEGFRLNEFRFNRQLEETKRGLADDLSPNRIVDQTDKGAC